MMLQWEWEVNLYWKTPDFFCNQQLNFHKLIVEYLIFFTMCQARLHDFLQESDLQARLHIILLGLKCRRDYIFLARPKLAG